MACDRETSEQGHGGMHTFELGQSSFEVHSDSRDAIGYVRGIFDIPPSTPAVRASLGQLPSVHWVVRNVADDRIAGPDIGFSLTRAGFEDVRIEITAAACGDLVRARVPAVPPVSGYEVVRRGCAVSVVTDGDAGRTTVLTAVVRDLWRRTVENLNGIIVHGSSVDHGERGCLVMGDQGAGKTSVALSLAVGAGWHVVDNDRTALVPTPEGIVALPVPMIIRVGRGTLDGLGKWDRFLDSVAQLRRQPASIGPSSTDKYELIRQELSQICGVEFAPATVLSAVVVPRRIPGSGRLNFRELTQDEVLSAFRGNTYTPRDPSFADDYLLIRRRTPEELHSTARDVLREVTDLPAVQAEYVGASAELGRELAGALEKRAGI